jgi:hypothetical protein
MVLVAEVGGDLGSLNESIAALTANQKLLIDAELKTCKRRGHIESNPYQ